MTFNEKIRTEDVVEILDTKIKTTSSHSQLGVVLGEYYDSVLSKISACSPSLLEKNALDAAQSPSGTNPFVTRSELTIELSGKIPWHTIGPIGSGATYEGTTESAFITAFSSGYTWFLVLAGDYMLNASITVPSGTKLQGASAASTILSSTDSLVLSNDVMVSNLTVSLQASGTAMSATGVSNVELQNIIVTTVSGSYGLSANASSLRVFDCSFQTGVVTLTSCFETYFFSSLFDTPGSAFLLDSPVDASLTGCIFKNGRFDVTNGRYVRAVGNHFADGMSPAPWGTNFTYTSLDVDVPTSTFTYVGHGLVDGDKVLMGSTVALPSPMMPGMYFIIGSTADTFQVSLTAGGSFISLADQGSGVQSLELRENLFRANTPNTVNNESDDLFALIEYMGAPDTTSTEPLYANNYGGPAGQDLTARVSALDLLTQWRYEERNFLMLAAVEPFTVTWNPTTHGLTSTGAVRLQSIHRVAAWTIDTLNATIPNGYALYYVLDRSLTTSDIMLTPQLGTIGSIPNDADNRQVFVLAFCLGSTLWWRGNGGARFSATAGQSGTYFIDGTSKSILDYIGAADVNDSNPNYSGNFAGVQSESLTTRVSKTDELLQRLFEYSNLNWTMDGYIGFDSSTITVSGTLYLTFPQVVGRITVGSMMQSMASGDMMVLSWDQSTLAGSDVAATLTMTSFGGLPMPEDNQTIKYLAFAWRSGDDVWLWDGAKLPNTGGRWPVPTSADVRLITPPQNLFFNPSDVSVAGNTIAYVNNWFMDGHPVRFSSTGTLPGPLVAGTTYYVVQSSASSFKVSTISGGSEIDLVDQGTGSHNVQSIFTENVVWNGTGLTWVNLSVATSTGQNLTRNRLADQITPLTLSSGQGVVVTFTWNPGADQAATTAVVTLPANPNQNQMLWAQNWNGVFTFS